VYKSSNVRKLDTERVLVVMTFRLTWWYFIILFMVQLFVFYYFCNSVVFNPSIGASDDTVLL